MIFAGKAGGFMAGFAKLVGEARGLEFAPIKFEITEDLATGGLVAILIISNGAYLTYKIVDHTPGVTR